MRRIVSLSLLVFSLAITIAGQTRPPVTPPEYGQFETLATVPNRGGLSPDGRWLAYGINRSNRNNELRIANVADGTTKVAAFGAQPVFSADSRWVAYAIGYSEAQEDKLRKDKKPIQRKLGLMNLTTGEMTVVDAVESFAFNVSGSYLAMRRYPPEKKESPDAGLSADGDDTPPGATLILRQLVSGRDTTFGNVAEFAWQDKGKLLAITISAEDKTGNGVQLFDPETGALRVLDSSSSIYSGLAWRKDSADLAVLRSKTDDRRDGPTQVTLAWTHLDSSEARHDYDPTTDKAFPPGLRLVAFRKPSWSDDGATVFLGVAKWNEKPPAAKTNVTATNSDGASAAPADDEEPADVDVWHSHDLDVMPKQKIGARSDRQRNMLAAWRLGNDRLVQLGKELTEQVTPVKRQQLAFTANWSAYAMERTIGRPAADIYLTDLATGERTRIKERLPEDRYLQASPQGRYLVLGY